MAEFEIKKYQVHVTAGETSQSARAVITMFSDKSNTIGSLVFVEPGTPMPGNTLTGIFQGWFPMSSYPVIIDLLRNEKPVFLSIVGSNFAIISGLEPVGEGEPAASPIVKFPFKPV